MSETITIYHIWLWASVAGCFPIFFVMEAYGVTLLSDAWIRIIFAYSVICTSVLFGIQGYRIRLGGEDAESDAEVKCLRCEKED